ncbi:MAG TPA: septation protein A [Xanthobacteraceae bacterium]|jgi:intracellular septation protein|nr:septation protein A [Xanthobacteraceae bacterium]HWA03053.1 septation protein A [Rhizomicrobium sp.]
MNPQLRRLALDLGPLFVFFAAYRFLGIYAATAVFMAAVLVALALDYAIERRFSPVPIMTAVLVVIFGGLTLYLKNAIFIKMKPTALYTLFGLTLLGGLYFNRLFLKYLLSLGFEMPDAAWRTLTFRYGIFFLALAAANEIVWRNFSESVWVDFKVWGVIPLILLFSLSQAPFLLRHERAGKGSGGASP